MSSTPPPSLPLPPPTAGSGLWPLPPPLMGRKPPSAQRGQQLRLPAEGHGLPQVALRMIRGGGGKSWHSPSRNWSRAWLV